MNKLTILLLVIFALIAIVSGQGLEASEERDLSRKAAARDLLKKSSARDLGKRSAFRDLVKQHGNRDLLSKKRDLGEDIRRELRGAKRVLEFRNLIL
ncbi:UNKNOWN [Stylonychia lemnae]|uniref:Uncharacterized protein n=1 Tax=Stylonychia lemnae TaxID=5949 RepID=A0A078AT81_STYLE|nr:UNKNOWN [Stylonychia lemnae]|eukprot:CDW85394.1 UNKNOWN [Stylonychia lemnae]